MSMRDEGPAVKKMMSSEKLGDNMVILEAVTECKYRRGYCLLHNTKGDKNVVRSKRWDKVKYGNGWIHSSKVRYSCRTKSGIPQITEQLDEGRSDSQSLTPANLKSQKLIH